MTLRIILLVVLTFLVVRGLRSLLGGALAAGGGGRPAKEPPMKLVRDPVCGTHVAPRASLSLAAGGTTHYFCSDDCRKKYRARM